MRSNIRVAIILSLALIGGCQMSAGITRGQEADSVVVTQKDDFRRVMNSSARLRAYNSKGVLEWMGSGNVYKIEDNRMYILSNNHVCKNPNGKITAEFLVNGKNLGEFEVRVDMCVEDNGVDIAVVSLNVGKTLKDVPFVPLKDHKVKVGDEFFHCGSDAGHPQNAQLGEIIEVTEEHFLFWPAAYAGDSGSSVVAFDNDGNPFIVGLVAWNTYHDNRLVGMAMKSKVVLDVLAGGDLPELPKAGDLPSPEQTDRLIQGLLERLRELRDENRRDRQSMVDRLSEMQMQNAMQDQEARIFRDLFKKQQQQDSQKVDGLHEKVMGQFDTLKALIKFAKWSFYALVAALLVSIFAGQGWLTRVIVTIFKVLFSCIRGTIAIIADAISRPIKKTETPSAALDNLREEIATIDDAP